MNIRLFKVFMSPTVGWKVQQTLYSGFIGQGEKVNQFEKDIAEFLGCDNVLTLNSATSALHLALHMIKTNDAEVLCTPLTCTASNFPVILNGLRIKWVDVDVQRLTMDLKDLESKITSSTKIIMLVLWGGYPIDFNELNNILDRAEAKHGFRPFVILDGAHSFGSKFNGKNISEYADITCYSFQAIKHITTVDGGCMVIKDKKLYDRAKLLRWYGIDRDNPKTAMRCEDNIPEVGFKFHMNDVNATIGIENLKHANDIVAKHQENAAYYDANIKNKYVTLLTRESGGQSAVWIYSLLVDEKESFIKYMSDNGIDTSQVHERNDKHTALSEFKIDLPTLDKVVSKMIAIPVGWWITEQERNYIVKTINNFTI